MTTMKAIGARPRERAGAAGDRWPAVRWLGFFAVALATLAMTACGGTVQERLGMSRRAPDEFQVVRRQPLVIPPDYRLPAPGTPSPAQQRRDVARDVQTALLGGAAAAPANGPSRGEEVLLAAVPGTVQPGIRDLILTENTELTQLDESRFLFILDFQRRNMTAASGAVTPIDPAAEAARLEAEGASARVVTRRVGSTIVQ
jgi:hypothetical protein